MPDSVPTNERFIHRLAEGVRRARLVDPILSARPAMVVISAPSGYGKTVLAAQLAVTGAFDATYWINSVGGGSSVEDDLGALADRVTCQESLSAPRSPLSSRRSCHEALASLADDERVLFVIDDAAWAGDSAALTILDAAMSEAPLGSLALVTTRSEVPEADANRGAWVLGSEQLKLIDEELGDVWARYTGDQPRTDVVSSLAAATGRHAALLSLMARQASLMGLSSLPPDFGSNVSTLINSLAAEQLDSAECDLLDLAAVLGQGDVAVLSQLSQSGAELRPSLSRIARVIPLVSISSCEQERFIVHDLVADSRGSARALAQRSLPGFVAAIETMAAAGRHARGLETAVRSGCREVVCDFLGRYGSHMLSTTAWESVLAALNDVPPAIYVADAHLLAVKAEADWAAGKRSQAIQEAQLALRLDDLADDQGESLAIRLLLAGMRMPLADFGGVVSDVGPLLSGEQSLDNDDMAAVLYAAICAYAYQANRPMLNASFARGAELLRQASASPLSLSRLEASMALVVDVFEGSPEKAGQMFRRACVRPGVPSHWRAGVTGNIAAAALEAGDLEGARLSLAEAMQALDEYCTPLDKDLRGLLARAIAVLCGENVALRESFDGVVASCDAEGEQFTLILSCIRGSELAAAMRDFTYARSLSERGLSAAIETGSPVLTWLTELVQAMANLGLGDVDRARATATRILPQAEAIGAMAHVLHARLTLAEVAMRDDDLSLAVHHLSAVSEHIVDKSPALIVACYLRAFPDLLGPLALAMGVDVVPIRVLNMVVGDYQREAFEAAAAVLTKPELRRLTARVRKEAARVAAREQAARDEPSLCEVGLFGGLSVKAPHGIVGERDWTKRKARLLFAMLVSRGGTDVPRSEIIEYLWPHMDEERGLSNFYVVWSAMKRALSPGGVTDQTSPFVEHMHGVCRVLQGRVVSDLDRFKAALSRARIAHAAGDHKGELSALLEAIEMYRGDVLPGDVYDDWFGSVRERFKQDYEDTALRASRLYADAGEPLEALAILRAASAHNPWREDLYQAILRLQIATGQRAAAIETYLMCRSRLVEDLGIDPSRETTALYEVVLGMDEKVA